MTEPVHEPVNPGCQRLRWGDGQSSQLTATATAPLPHYPLMFPASMAVLVKAPITCEGAAFGMPITRP